MDGEVRALAVIGTNLYAGGLFWTPEEGGFGVARWDGRAWLACGRQPDSTAMSVLALAVSGTDLYAGGGFINAGGVAATNIAKWDGSGWSAVGSGIWGCACPNPYPIIVEALAVSGTNLYAGGWFGVGYSIAKWDGSTWSGLGSGLNGLVYALAVSGTNLNVGGNLATAGGDTVTNIAKWDGHAWSALGSGISGGAHGEGGAINALAVIGTDLYAGGDFTTAGGVPANYIAKWDGSAWSALGSGLDLIVNALAADGAGHLFVGGRFSLAGTNVSPLHRSGESGYCPDSFCLTAHPKGGGRRHSASQRE